MKVSSRGVFEKDRFEREPRPLAPAYPVSPPARAADRESVFILLMLFSTLSVCLIVKSVAIQYPSVLGDEYYYSILSRYFGRSAQLIAHDKYLVVVPNELYLWVFGATHFLRDNFYPFAKIFNSLLFAAAIFPIYATSHLFLRRRPALLISTLVILAPVDSYTVYFMPESCYFLGFWLFTYLFISGLPGRALRAGLMGGVALGLLVLIKPHALAVLAAANLTIMVVMLLPESFDFRLKDALTCLAVLDTAFLLSVAALHIGFFGHRDADIFGYYRRMAGVSIPDRLLYARQVLMVALGHLAYAAPIFGLPIVATMLGALGILSPGTGQTRDRLRIFTIFSILLLGVLLMMTASSSVMFALASGNPIELARLGARYYNFALPLVLISLYALLDRKTPDSCRTPLVCGTLACLILAALGWMFFAPRLSIFVVDDPEMAWLTQPFPIAGSIFWAATFLMLGYYLVNGLEKTAVYSRYLVLSLIGGSLLIFFAQYRIDQQIPADRGAALIRALFEGAERDRGMVVGSDLGIIFRCLFGIQANPSVLVLAHGAALGPAEVGGDPRWILALDDYDLRMPSTTLLAAPGLKIVRLRAPAERSRSDGPPHLKMAQQPMRIDQESARWRGGGRRAIAETP